MTIPKVVHTGPGTRVEKLNEALKALSRADGELKALSSVLIRCDDELIERASSVDIPQTLDMVAGMVGNLTDMLSPALDAEFGDGFAKAVAYGNKPRPRDS